MLNKQVTRLRQAAASALVSWSKARASPFLWDLPQFPAAHRPAPARLACGIGLPDSSAPLPRSLPALARRESQTVGAGPFPPAWRRFRKAGSALRKNWRQLKPQKFFPFQVRDRAARSVVAGPARGEILLLLPAFESA